MSKIDEEIENTLEYIERVCRTTNVAERHYMNGINSIKQHISNQQEEIAELRANGLTHIFEHNDIKAKLDKIKNELKYIHMDELSRKRLLRIIE